MMRRIVGFALGGLGLLMLLGSGLWLQGETRWVHYEALSPEEAFSHGSFGLELAPLKYMLVMGTVSHAAVDRGNGKPWPQAFGFVAPKAGVKPCITSGLAALPKGFSISKRLPNSATPVPYPFVGLTCATCHSTEVRHANGERTFVNGGGSMSADVIAFSDAIINALQDPNLTGEKIVTAYDQQCGADSGMFAGLNRRVEALLYDQWLSGFRSVAAENASKYDLPYHGVAMGKPDNIPAGPSRTRPFRSVVRNTLDLPGLVNNAYSKVPMVAMQADKQWSQYDGSIDDPTVRSMVAVYTSGASPAALADPQIEHDIRAAADYTLHLGEQPALPTLTQVFPEAPVAGAAQLNRGRTIYMASCNSCHGHPTASGWSHEGSANFGKIEPVIGVAAGTGLGTDPARVDFRHAEMVPLALPAILPGTGELLAKQKQALLAGESDAEKDGRLAEQYWWVGALAQQDAHVTEFPAGHPLAFAPQDIRLNPGYINGPIPYVWLRAPYLHNGSVPTLRQLLGLDARQDHFCRGSNVYSPVLVGLVAPEPNGRGVCPEDQPFAYDIAVPGNSNQGHWYPWNYREAQAHRPELEDLLAYLRTI